MGSANLLCFWLLCVILYTALTFVSSGEVPTVYAHLGDDVTIPCELDESQTDVQWTRGANVEDSEVNLLVYILGGVEDGDCILSDKCALTRRDLILRNVELSDQDRYYCSASSGKEYTENKLSILIEPEMPYPMINFCGDDQNCTFPFPVGYPLWLRCEVSGSLPAVDLVWYNGTDVIDDIKTEAKETVQGTYDTVSRLKIKFSTHSVFRCEAVGESIPNERTAIAAINFTERDWPDFDDIILPTAATIVEPLKPYPRITHCDEDVVDCTYIFPNGYNLLLTCEVEGSRPPVHLTWSNGTAELDSKETVYNITDGLFNTFSTLEVEHNDSSVYYCIASGMSLPGKGTASITVAEEDLVPAAQEGLSGGGKAAVAAGGVVSVGVVAGVAREPIMKTGSSVLKKIPGMGGQEKESSSGKKRATKAKKRRKKEDVEADLGEDEELIDEDETEMKDMHGSQVHDEDEIRTQSRGKSKKTKHKTKCQIHQEVEDEEDSVENANMQMKGIQPSDAIDSNEEVEGEEKEDENDQEDEDEDESKEDEEDIEESTQSSKKEGKRESSFFSTGFSSLLEGPKHGFDSLKATIMEKVEGVTSSGKDVIGKYVPTSADELMEDLQETISEKTQQLQDTVTEKTNELQSELEDKAKGLHTSIEDKAKELHTSVEDKAKGLQTSIEDKAKGLQTSVEDKAKGLQTSIEDKAKELQTSVEDTTKGLQTSIEDKAKRFQTSVEDKTKGLQTSVEDKAKGLHISVEDKAKGLHISVEDKAKGFQTSVKDKAKGLQTSVED
ncbi:uncharacterized protein [Apostichopus japonicus]|uniref:uncharacterized protein isoform X2 n=1 Tax=Stichopus japonicus TaxID=307972 RepID=UPI003AB51C6E